jgi:hypothetical protein
MLAVLTLLTVLLSHPSARVHRSVGAGACHRRMIPTMTQVSSTFRQLMVMTRQCMNWMCTSISTSTHTNNHILEHALLDFIGSPKTAATAPLCRRAAFLSGVPPLDPKHRHEDYNRVLFEIRVEFDL